MKACASRDSPAIYSSRSARPPEQELNPPSTPSLYGARLLVPLFRKELDKLQERKRKTRRNNELTSPRMQLLDVGGANMRPDVFKTHLRAEESDHSVRASLREAPVGLHTAKRQRARTVQMKSRIFSSGVGRGYKRRTHTPQFDRPHAKQVSQLALSTYGFSLTREAVSPRKNAALRACVDVHYRGRSGGARLRREEKKLHSFCKWTHTTRVRSGAQAGGWYGYVGAGLRATCRTSCMHREYSAQS